MLLQAMTARSQHERVKRARITDSINQIYILIARLNGATPPNRSHLAILSAAVNYLQRQADASQTVSDGSV